MAAHPIHDPTGRPKRKRGEYSPINCRQCGHMLERKFANHQYHPDCFVLARRAASNARNNRGIIGALFECPSCGVPTMKTHSVQRYCRGCAKAKDVARKKKGRTKILLCSGCDRVSEVSAWAKHCAECSKEMRRKYYLEWRRKNRAATEPAPKERLERVIRAGVNSEIRKGSKRGRRTFRLLGYTIDDLRLHIERQFTKGMTWKNHGLGAGKWHIDHILPLSSFSYETPDDPEFKAAWALSNLRPSWQTDNCKKHSKRLFLI